MNNKKLLIIGVSICLIALLAAFLGEGFMKLEEPLFLKSYLEIPVYNDGNKSSYNRNLNLKYITNQFDDIVISGISLDSIHEDFKSQLSYVDINQYYSNLPWSSYNANESFERYFQNEIETSWNLNLPNYDKDFEFTRLRIDYYDNNSKKNKEKFLLTDIGHIIFYKCEEIRENNTLEHISSSNSRGDSYFYLDIIHETPRTVIDTFHEKYLVKSDIELVSLESKLLEEFKDFFKVTVNGMDYREIEGKIIKAGTELETIVTGEVPLNFMFGEIMIHPRITYKDMKGNLYSLEAAKIWMRTRVGVNKIVKEMRSE